LIVAIQDTKKQNSDLEKNWNSNNGAISNPNQTGGTKAQVPPGGRLGRGIGDFMSGLGGMGGGPSEEV
jgi:hypothetical protein